MVMERPLRWLYKMVFTVLSEKEKEESKFKQISLASKPEFGV